LTQGIKNSLSFLSVHSTRGGLAVYISSDESQLNFIVGKSFIFNIDTKKTITEVLYPKSVYTTTYGIWYNGITDCTRSYTISGGFSLTGPYKFAKRIYNGYNS